MTAGRAVLARRAVALLLALSPAVLAPPAAAAAKKTIIGRLEKAWIDEAGVTLTAKIDTGTRTSSLGVADVHLLRRGGSGLHRPPRAAGFGIDNVDLLARASAHAQDEPPRLAVETDDLRAGRKLEEGRRARVPRYCATAPAAWPRPGPAPASRTRPTSRC